MTDKLENKKRWDDAQKYEMDWWRNHVDSIDLSFYRDYAERAAALLKDHLSLTENTRVIEAGSGAAGIISFLPGSQRYAFDPLERFFSSVRIYAEFRDPGVKYLAAQAEGIPFKSGHFDLAVMDNVLDHCQNIDRVLAEVALVLRNGGILYLRTNVFSGWGRIVRIAAELFWFDKGHPHTFTEAILQLKFMEHGFNIVKKEGQGFTKNWMSQLRSKKVRQMIASVLFVTQKPVTYILKK